MCERAKAGVDMGGEEKTGGDMYVWKGWQGSYLSECGLFSLGSMLPASTWCITGSSRGLTAALRDTVVSEIYT